MADTSVFLDEKESALIKKEYGFSDLDFLVVRDQYAKKFTPTEFKLFISIAKEYKYLSIVRKEIRAYKDNLGNLIIFCGRDGFQRIAQQDTAYEAVRSCEVRENDEFEASPADFDNPIVHKFGKGDRGAIVGARAIAKAKGRVPVFEYVDFKTYNKGSSVWKTHPAEMIKKVAESHALKRQYSISNIYSEAEEDSIRGLDRGDNKPTSDNVIDAQTAEQSGIFSTLSESIDKAQTSDELDAVTKEIADKKEELGKTELDQLRIQHAQKKLVIMGLIKKPAPVQEDVLPSDNVIEGVVVPN